MSSFKQFLFILGILISFSACTQNNNPILVDYEEVISGDKQLEAYLPLLKGKSVAVVANQASMVNDIHLVDTLLEHKVNIVKIFCPEHGFRGTASAGELINDDMDPSTGIPILSLY